MTIKPDGFPLDLTGSNPRNLITNDTYVLSTNDDMVFIPAGGPFFTESLVVRAGTSVLKPNVDYKCLHMLKDASVASGLSVSALVYITRENISEVTLDYRVIGGQYSDTVPVIRELVSNLDTLEPGINWNTQVYAKPDLYPPAPHFVEGSEFSDWADVTMGLRNVERAILLKDVAAWGSMYQYLENLITNKIGLIDLTNFANKTYVNLEVVKLAPKVTVYTKEEADSRYYTKSQVESRIGDIDGNETYYTEREINAKFIEIIIADGKYATKAELNRVDSNKADITSVYTRAQSDDKYVEKTKVYQRDWIDANLVSKGVSYIKSEADARFAYKGDAYTRVEADNRFALRSQIPQAQDLSKFIKADYVDGTYLRIAVADSTYLRKSTADSVYAKLTDLSVIKTLTEQFLNYYTKFETDNTFVNKNFLSGNYLNNTQLNQQYLSRIDAANTYATKNELKVTADGLTAHIETKGSTDWVNVNFVTKSILQTTHYTKTDSDNKYFDKSFIQNYYVDNDKLSKIVANLATASNMKAQDNAILANFTNYYTKTESDNLYYSKQTTDAMYLTKNVFNDFSNTTNAQLNTKSDTSWVLQSYYNRSDSDNRFMSIAGMSNYYQKAEADSRFTNSAWLNRHLPDTYLSKVDFSNNWTWLAERLTSFAVKNEVYTRGETDAKYLLKNLNKLTITSADDSPENGGIDLFGNSTNGTTMSPGMRFFVNSDKNAIVFTNNDYAGKTAELRVHLKSFVDGQILPSFIVNNNGVWHRAYGYLHDKFMSKGESYTKQETDNKYIPLNPNSITTYGSGGDIVLTKANPNENNSPAIYFARGGQHLARTIVYWNSEYKSWGYEISLPKSQGATYEGTLFIYYEGIYHRAYGNLHDYFRKASDSYSKGETYNRNETFSKTEINNSFYNKDYCNGTYFTKAEWNSGADWLVGISNTKVSYEWFGQNAFNRTQSDERYYTKSQLDGGFYNRGQADSAFATKTELSAGLNKKLDTLSFNAHAEWVNNVFNKKADSEWVTTNYASKGDVNVRATWDWVNANFYNMADSNNRYYRKDEVNDNFVGKPQFDSVINGVNNRLNTIESKLQMYKVGDIYLTVNNYVNGSAVNASMGYGTWVRFAQGRTLVGMSPNGWLDEIATANDWYDAQTRFRDATKELFSTYGEYNHILTIDEMPSHKHSQNDVFNKFMGMYGDFNASGWNTSALDEYANTVSSGDDTNGGFGGKNGSFDEAVIKAHSGNTWPRMTEQYRGSSRPHTNTQPSITIGIWRRIG